MYAIFMYTSMYDPFYFYGEELKVRKRHSLELKRFIAGISWETQARPTNRSAIKITSWNPGLQVILLHNSVLAPRESKLVINETMQC